MDHNIFEEQFAVESLKSDRLRVSILVGAMLSGLVIILVLIPIFRDEFESLFHGNVRGFFTAIAVVFGVNVCNLVVLGRLPKARRRPFTPLRYVSPHGRGAGEGKRAVDLVLPGWVTRICADC